MATQFGRFRILFRKSFIENVYINILKNKFFCNLFYLIIFLKHLRCFFTNAYGVRICSACGGNSRRHFGRTMCLHTKDTSTGQPTAGRSKLPSAAGVFRKTCILYRHVFRNEVPSNCCWLVDCFVTPAVWVTYKDNHDVQKDQEHCINQRTNGPVNAHLRSVVYTNKHV